MILFLKGDIFKTKVDALVNPVNCLGVCGAGLAAAFKDKFPDNYENYKLYCELDKIKPGKMHVFPLTPERGWKYIINFPTKQDWKFKSKLEDISLGLDDLILNIKKLNIKSIAIPALGCGLGGLDWKEVREEIDTKLKELDDVRILIFEPTKR